MGTTDLSTALWRRLAWVCGGAVAGVGAAALAGWVADQPVLLGLHASYIPMAPNTALAFFTLGLGLCAVVGNHPAGRALGGLGAAMVLLIGVLRLIEFATGADLAVDRWFFHVRNGTFGLAPLGKMSLPTAAAFLAASTAVISLSVPPTATATVLARWRPSGDLAGGCGLIAGVTGLVFAMGYLFSPNAALLYGTQAIPMALNTAVCFVGLGSGLVSAAGPGAFPLLRLCGPSIHARLLRSFLPLVVVTVGLVAWLTHVVTSTAGASTAAVSAAALATVAILAFGVICERIAGRVGGQLERAEAALQCANDLLEIMVDERTHELSRALSEIRASHESLQAAHRDLKQTQSRML